LEEEERRKRGEEKGKEKKKKEKNETVVLLFLHFFRCFYILFFHFECFVMGDFREYFIKIDPTSSPTAFLAIIEKLESDGHRRSDLVAAAAAYTSRSESSFHVAIHRRRRTKRDVVLIISL